MKTPILQFGTSRFLQAHADLFVSEAMEHDAALGPITIVQTTGAKERAHRLRALAAPGGFPVIIRGLVGDEAKQSTVQVKSVVRALSAQEDWDEICRIFVEEVEVVISNTGDTGYDISAEPSQPPTIPPSFPGKLLALLFARYVAGGHPLTLLPCELITRNGDALKLTLLALAKKWKCEARFISWLTSSVIYGCTLVDRIVSEPLEPAGAIAEPYALWAIENQPGMVLPATHESIVITDDLTRFERLKLHILNLGHTILANIWLEERRNPDETVFEMLSDSRIRDELEHLYATEVVPAFANLGLKDEATAYVQETMRRFRNPYLKHRLSDIANHHAQKKERRIRALLDLCPDVAMPGLAAIAS